MKNLMLVILLLVIGATSLREENTHLKEKSSQAEKITPQTLSS